MTDQTAATPALKPEEKPTAKPAKKLRTVTKWIRRHHRLLTFIGALIVFATFIFKDALRERFKDLADSIERAESLHAIRSDVNATESAVRTSTEAIKNKLDFQRDPMLLGRMSTIAGIPRYEVLWKLSEDLSWPENLGSNTELEYDRQKRLFEVASDLAAKLPKSSNIPFKALVAEIAGEFDGIKQEARTCSDEADDLMRRPHEMKREQEVWKQCYEVRDKEQALLERGNKAIGDLLGKARQIKDRNDQRYLTSTWVSYFLYGFGWGLGLVGRLVGVETGAVE